MVRRWRELLDAKLRFVLTITAALFHRRKGPMSASITLRAGGGTADGKKQKRATTAMSRHPDFDPVCTPRLFQGLDVLYDVSDLGIGEFALEGRHLALTVGDQGGEVGDGRL